MAYKCEICKDRGAVMGLNHPFICECQKESDSRGVYNEHLQAFFRDGGSNLGISRRVKLEFDDPHDSCEYLEKLYANRAFYLRVSRPSEGKVTLSFECEA